MRKIYLILSLLLLGGVITASAQKKITGTIKGKLVDSVNKEPMAGATVTVMNPKDSSVVSFKVANAKGEFEIGDLEIGRAHV